MSQEAAPTSLTPLETTTLHFNTTFADFKYVQNVMTRHAFSKNKGAYGRALIAVVACATFIVMAMVINLRPASVRGLLGLPYPLSVYVAVILCLIAAIFSLLPAIKLRFQTLRMQISDDSPLLAMTTLTIRDGELVVERPLIVTKYRWGAFRSVEISKGHVILAIDNGMGLIIPQSAFANEAARYAFVAEVSKRMASVGSLSV